MRAKAKVKKVIKPIQIALPENTMLPNGTLFIKLPTLALLETFWKLNRERFAYAAKGIELTTGQDFLNECEWVFGNSKSAVVETAFRWHEMGITAKFYDWAKESSDSQKAWFHDRDIHALEHAKTNKEPESPTWYTTCTPETYRGWWQIQFTLPAYDGWDWLCDSGSEEITDWTLPISVANEMLQAQIFDALGSGTCADIEYVERREVDKEILYWLDERASGRDYYGSENENPKSQFKSMN